MAKTLESLVGAPALLPCVRELGCDVVQGYLISRPLPAPAFIERQREINQG